MATVGQERSQPVLLQTAEPLGEADARLTRRPEPKFGNAAVIFSLVIGGGLMALVFYSSRAGYDEPAKLIAPENDPPSE